MNAKPTATVRVTHRFSAPAERVFDAWLDPARAGKWLFATPDGEMLKVEIDARVGGKFSIVRRRAEDGDVEHSWRISRAWTARAGSSSPSACRNTQREITRVSIDIVAQGTGCELTLTHDGVLPEWKRRRRRAGA